MNKTDIHPIQSLVLCELLFVEEATFSELNKKHIGTDAFSFHLRQLTDWGFITKTPNGKYSLTNKGKEYANRFDTQATEVERQPKIGVLVVGVRKNKGNFEYLIQKRLKQPYFGYSGFLTGKIKWGETIGEAAERETLEETGLDGKLKLVGIKHKMDYATDEKLLEDKYFLVFLATELKGQLKEKFVGGENHWMKKEDILKLNDMFDGVEESINMVEASELNFVENKYKIAKY